MQHLCISRTVICSSLKMLRPHRVALDISVLSGEIYGYRRKRNRNLFISLKLLHKSSAVTHLMRSWNKEFALLLAPTNQITRPI